MVLSTEGGGGGTTLGRIAKSGYRVRLPGKNRVYSFAESEIVFSVH